MNERQACGLQPANHDYRAQDLPITLVGVALSRETRNVAGFEFEVVGAVAK